MIEFSQRYSKLKSLSRQFFFTALLFSVPAVNAAPNTKPVLTSPLAATTLIFTSNGSWADGIAEDGEGGSINIPGITIQVRNISDIFGTTKTPITWQNNSFLSSNLSTYSALTLAENAGSKGMSIKSSDGSEFQLNSFKYYNWGEAEDFTNTVKGYRNGAEVASMTFNGLDQSAQGYIPLTISLDNTFDNVDDVRIYISAGGYVGDQSATNHSINNIEIDAASPLPVTLVSFNAKAVENEIELSWRTASETNASHFEIEAGSDGKTFSTRGSVIAKGESQADENYTFTDRNKEALTYGRQYYRLKMIDNDGTFAYSRILSVSTTDQQDLAKVTFAPNPLNGKSGALNLYFDGLKQGTYTVEILNILGQKRVEKTFAWDGKSTANMETKNLSSGMYLVRTIFEGKEIVKRLLVE